MELSNSENRKNCPGPSFDSFLSGNCRDAYRMMGAHPTESGYTFRVWAPNALSVAVVGDFNGWDPSAPGAGMRRRDGGIWETTVEPVGEYCNYKYSIVRKNGTTVLKSDPYGFHTATRPENASKTYDLSGFAWTDGDYLKKRSQRQVLSSPVNIYEVHLGSWRIHDDGNPYSYLDLAETLPQYAKEMGYTHIELLPVAEHPFDPSWGYQVTGFYAPTSRFGTPKDFMKLIDRCHELGIGVILDWVGAHFPKDENGLYEFDGSCLYESSDPLMNEHPDWNTRIFDYSRYEVRSFLISNVCYWLDLYHVDGIRVDAVASMLYLDYGRKNGQWRRNRDGGNINTDAVALLRDVNTAAFAVNPSVLMIAEESTAFPMITKPGYDGGVGFNFKWNMGWMHDMIDYMSADPLFRKGLHNRLTFSLSYAFSENFILPFSHDEVVHGKCSMINKMPGEYDAKFASLRTLYTYMFTHPGKKLNFMGNEFAQFIEWDFAKQLDWFLLDYDAHRKMQNFSKDLNHLYLDNPPLWENDSDWEGFHWISADDSSQSVVAFYRTDRQGRRIVVVCSFCPVARENYRIGIPDRCTLAAIFCSDDVKYGGGTETEALPKLKTEKMPMHGCEQSVSLNIPGMSALCFAEVLPRGRKKEKKE